LDETEDADHARVLMTFTRADVGDANINQKSGEMVLIEEISDKPLALIYQSNLAEERIKSEIRDAISVFHKGFVVDTNVTARNGRPVAYAVVNVHQIIDLPMEDNNDDIA
jgi:hypothetical protein